MVKIIAISGSLRTASYNSALLRAAVDSIKAGVIEIASIADIPLYNGDLEKQGMPKAVTELQTKFENANGILLASPEYNHGIPGVLKNTIDWLSRPPEKIGRVFAGKPLAMLGATPGGFGTLNAQTNWLPIWRTLHVHLWNEQGPFMISRAQTVFDANGKITDEKVQENLKNYIEGFVGFVAVQKEVRLKYEGNKD
jgi:chromate reductase